MLEHYVRNIQKRKKKLTRKPKRSFSREKKIIHKAPFTSSKERAIALWHRIGLVAIRRPVWAYGSSWSKFAVVVMLSASASRGRTGRAWCRHDD